MERKHVKTFRVVGETITKNGQPTKTLGSKIDAEINAFLDANDGIDLADLVINSSLGGSTEHAVVTMVYTGELASAEAPAAEEAQDGPATSAPVTDAPDAAPAE